MDCLDPILQIVVVVIPAIAAAVELCRWLFGLARGSSPYGLFGAKKIRGQCEQLCQSGYPKLASAINHYNAAEIAWKLLRRERGIALGPAYPNLIGLVCFLVLSVVGLGLGAWCSQSSRNLALALLLTLFSLLMMLCAVICEVCLIANVRYIADICGMLKGRKARRKLIKAQCTVSTRRFRELVADADSYILVDLRSDKFRNRGGIKGAWVFSGADEAAQAIDLSCRAHGLGHDVLVCVGSDFGCESLEFVNHLHEKGYAKVLDLFEMGGNPLLIDRVMRQQELCGHPSVPS